MENQHRLIAGYRELDENEIAAMNEFKRLEAVCIAGLETVAGWADPRWCAIARTHLEQGFMAAGRAVARPTGYHPAV